MWWLVGLSGALVCATLTHGYAAVLFVPIVLGEIARTINYRRVDWPIWTAFVVALPAMLVPLRLLVSVTHNLSTTSTTLFPRATLPMLGETYKSLLGPSTLVLSGLLLVWSIAEIMGSRRVLERSDDYKPKLHEMVALFTFVAVPIIVFVLSKVSGAPFFTRYSIICIAGFAGLLGFATARKLLVGIGLVGLLITHIGMDLVQYARRDFIIETSSSSRLSTDSVKFSEMYAAMATASEQTLPIVLLDFAEFLPAFHYAPPDLVPRLYYIIRSDPIGEEILKLKNCCNVPGNVVYLADFLSTHRKFLAYSNSRSYLKLDSFFIKAGANVTILGAHRESLLVSITLP